MSEAVAARLAALDADDGVRAKLETFATMLLERNAATNLTAARDPLAVLDHVEDSLALRPFVRTPLVDVGSGGGFPGIVLAIALDGPVTLVESVAKKARFLADVAERLELRATVLAERAEDVARRAEHRDGYASATARAVGSLATVLELTLPFLATDGVAVLQRGSLSSEERAAASDAALVLGGRVEDEIRTGSGDDERRLVVVRKIAAATGPRFPRRAGVPARRPLCWQGADG